MKRSLISLGIGLLALTWLCSPAIVSARDTKESEEAEAKEAKAAFIKSDPGAEQSF